MLVLHSNEWYSLKCRHVYFYGICVIIRKLMRNKKKEKKKKNLLISYHFRINSDANQCIIIFIGYLYYIIQIFFEKKGNKYVSIPMLSIDIVTMCAVTNKFVIHIQKWDEWHCSVLFLTVKKKLTHIYESTNAQRCDIKPNNFWFVYFNLTKINNLYVFDNTNRANKQKSIVIHTSSTPLSLWYYNKWTMKSSIYRFLSIEIEF